MIYLDIDGVVLDFIGTFNRYMKNIHKIKLKPNPNTWDMGLGELAKRYIDMFFESKYANWITTYDDVEQLFDLDFIFITCLDDKYSEARLDNMADMQFDQSIIFNCYKTEYLRDGFVDLFVDDNPVEIIKAAIAGINCAAPIKEYNTNEIELYNSNNANKIRTYNTITDLYGIMQEYL